jgi:hypothetical protein
VVRNLDRFSKEVIDVGFDSNVLDLIHVWADRGAIESGVGETQFRGSSSTSSVSMTGKPIKIPPKKV